MGHGVTELLGFTKALAQAIYDTEVEQRVAIRYYYDADVVLPLLLGIRLLPVDIDLRAHLFHALLSAGQLGKGHLLRPHALEVLNHIEFEASRHSLLAHEHYRALIAAWLTQHGVLENLRAIRAALHQDSDLPARSEQVLAILRKSGVRTFVALELARGDWQERLLRLHNTAIRFTEEGPQLRDALAHPAFARMHGMISKLRPSVQLNNLRDAIALTMLHTHVVARDQQTEQVRFNTQSDTLRRVFAADIGRSLLSYSTPELGLDEYGCGSIHRDAEYAVLRASFEALQPRRVRRTNSTPTVSLDELKSVAEELKIVLRSTAPSATQRAVRIRIGGRKLEDVLSDLQRFSFLDSVLAHYEPGGLDELANDLDELLSGVRAGETRDSLHTHIRREADKLIAQLANEVASTQKLFALVRDTAPHLESLRSVAHELRASDSLRDLGLARLGFVSPELDDDFVRAAISALFQPELADVLTALSLLVGELHEIDSAARCAGVCTVLMLLQQYQRIVDTINHFEESRGPISVPLHVFRIAARLWGRQRYSSGELLLQLEALETRIEAESSSLQGYRLVGLAHITILAARFDSDSSGPRLLLLERSLRLAQQALALLERWSLAWSFAVNHGLAAATIAGRPADSAKAHYRELRGLRASKHWHYRFANTLAMYHLDQATGILEGDRIDRSRSTAAAMHLEQASECLRDRLPQFGDLHSKELQLHIDDLLVRLSHHS